MRGEVEGQPVRGREGSKETLDRAEVAGLPRTLSTHAREAVERRPTQGRDKAFPTVPTKTTGTNKNPARTEQGAGTEMETFFLVCRPYGGVVFVSINSDSTRWDILGLDVGECGCF